MQVFIDKVLLPLLVAIVLAVGITNPMRLNKIQRTTIVLAAISLAVFLAYSLQLAQRKASQVPSSDYKQTGSSATTTGDNSPANTGMIGSFDYNETQETQKKSSPKHVKADGAH